MAYKLYSLPLVTIASAGTPQALTTNAGLAVSSAIITAASGNIGSVYVGGEDMTSATGEDLAPGDSIEIAADTLRGTNHEIFLSSIKVDGDTTGNTITVQYLKLK